MGKMECSVTADLRRYEAEQDELERNFDPSDLSEVTQEEVDAFWDDMPAKAKVTLMTCIRSEDWDLFDLTFRRELINFRTDI